MGRKKKGGDDVPQKKKIDATAAKSKSEKDPYDSSADDSEEEENFEMEPEINELACAFGIGDAMAQRLNNIMCGKRQKTWDQDIERLHEILKTAHSPSAVLSMKINDMEKGMFAGKCMHEKEVRALAERHRLDKTATTKLVEAIAIREGMKKDVLKDLDQLDEHLQNSNAPSKLVSMKLESMRKGYPVGHCVYAREPVVGLQAPGVDGVFDKKGKKGPAGYSDSQLQRRFAETTEKLSGTGGVLMDEAAIKRLMAKDREKTIKEEAKESKKTRGRKRDDSRSSRSRSLPKRKRHQSRSASRKKTKSKRSRSESRRKGKKR